MWEIVRYSNGFALKHDGQVVAIHSGRRDFYGALTDFATIVVNVLQAVPA